MIILSMIGVNDYKETSYTWGDRVAKPCHLVQQALAEWFAGATVLVCVTPEAKKKYEQEIRSIPYAHLVDIPSGKNEAEYWEMFNKIDQEIPHVTELVLDITHGFRSLPVLALLAVSFLRAAKQVRVRHVLYGAYDASRDGSTPVFDLTPFVTMLDWASATNRFLETGDASRFRGLVETKGARPLNTSLDKGVRFLDELSSALAANRAMRVGELAFKAKDSVEGALAGQWEASHEPLKLLLGPLQEGLGSLALDASSQAEEQLRQLFGQVKWYQRHRQYEKAIGLAREWMVCFAQWKQTGSWTPTVDKREETERWLNEAAKNPPQDEWKPFLALWKNLGHFRNDLLHFGFRDAPRKEHAIPEETARRLEELKTIAQSLGLELQESS